MWEENLWFIPQYDTANLKDKVEDAVRWLLKFQCCWWFMTMSASSHAVGGWSGFPPDFLTPKKLNLLTLPLPETLLR